MSRLSAIIILVMLVVCIPGCSAKPENVVRQYIKYISAYDVAGAKKLCTGKARDSLGTYQEDMEVKRVMVVGGDETTATGNSAADRLSNVELSSEKMTDDLVEVYAVIGSDRVTFMVRKENGRWLIDGVTDPMLGLLKRS